MNRYFWEELVGWSLAVVGIAVVWGLPWARLPINRSSTAALRLTRWWRDELLRIRQRLRHGLRVAGDFLLLRRTTSGDRQLRRIGERGWYWWPCFPRLPADGDPTPFETERDAVIDAGGIWDDLSETNGAG